VLVDEMSSRLRLQGASVPEGALSLAHWNPVPLQRRVSDLEVANVGQCSFASFFGYLINLLFILTHLLDCFLTDMAQQYSDLEEKYSQGQTELARRCSDLEEKYSQGQTELAWVSASLNDVNTLNSTLHAQLNSEKVTCESWLCLLCSYFLLDVWRN
jgi:uncharacterized protein YlxW (UPF0749 family)